MRERSGRPERVRLFFALWPNDEVRAALSRLSGMLHGACGGRRVPERNIHLTLAFVGNVAAELAPALARMASGVRCAPVDLAFDVVGYWPRNAIVWSGTTNCPPALRELVAALAHGLRDLGLPTETREYAPHVTLLRDARRGPDQRDFGTVSWRASEFVLVRSLAGAGAMTYDIIGQWRLAGPSL